MAEFNIDISTLPEDVRDKLAELDLELSEGRQTGGVRRSRLILLLCDALRREFSAAFLASPLPQRPKKPSQKITAE